MIEDNTNVSGTRTRDSRSVNEVCYSIIDELGIQKNGQNMTQPDKLKLAYIIDDDDVIIYLTDQIFAQEAFCERSKTFTDAEVALNTLKQALIDKVDVPDVILFDLNMPGMDGWMFIEEFQKLESNIPTFVFTSSIDPMDKQKSFGFKEIKDFITKPLTKNSLNKIRRLISN